MNRGTTVSRRATLKQLRAFCEVAECGGFNAAAQALHATQPAVSGHVRQLEQTLGVTLIERTTRSLTLTRAGSDLLPRLRAALVDIDTVLTDVSMLAHARRAQVGIAAAGWAVALLLAPLVASLRERHPDLTLRVIETGVRDVERLVQTGDAAFGVTTLDERRPGLDTCRLLSDRLGAVMARGHPLAASERALNWTMLAGETIVALTEDNSTCAMFDEAAARATMTGPRIEVSTVHAAVALASESGGIAVLPALCARAYCTASTVFRALDAPTLWRTVGIVRRRGSVLSTVDEYLLQHIRMQVRSLEQDEAIRPRVQCDTLRLRARDEPHASLQT